MKEGTEYNVNDHVWVQLHDEGKRIFSQYYMRDGDTQEDIFRIFRMQEDGWIELQMHTFMMVFGPAISLTKPLPFNANIRVVVKETAP